MAKIKTINLKNFRNFTSCDFNFHSNCNVLFGDNGTGKTNILESISLLGKGRGFRNSSISDLIFKEENNFFINAQYERDYNYYDIKIYSKLENEKYKKISSINDEISKTSKDFINDSFTFLYFLPEMERLFVSSPSQRRNFIDKLIFTENKNYNTLINNFKKKINERTKILQNFKIDKEWINVVENEIVSNGLKIYSQRKNQISILNNHINLMNNSNKYPFKIDFKIDDSIVNNELDEIKFKSCLQESREYDKKFGGTKVGPHKSDIIARINGKVEASKLSTGQQKTVVLMILIAQCNYLINDKKIRPILLFDEICSHLDQYNRKILLDLINNFDIQFFLTGTDKSLFSFISTNANFYNIKNI